VRNLHRDERIRYAKEPGGKANCFLNVVLANSQDPYRVIYAMGRMVVATAFANPHPEGYGSWLLP
jgi:hypothetical protein